MNNNVKYQHPKYIILNLPNFKVKQNFDVWGELSSTISKKKYK